MQLINLEGVLHMTTDSLLGYTMYKNPDKKGTSKIAYFGFNKAAGIVFIQCNKFAKAKSFIFTGVSGDIIDLYIATTPDIDEYLSEWIQNDKKPNRFFTIAEQTDMYIVEAKNDEVIKNFKDLVHYKATSIGLLATDKTLEKVFNYFAEKSHAFQTLDSAVASNLKKDWNEIAPDLFFTLLN